MRNPSDSLFEMQDTNGRRPPWLLRLAMLVLLIVVVFGLFQILPLGGEGGLRNRTARRLLAEGEQRERDSLERLAIKQYEKVVANEKANPRLRLRAAKRLVALNRDVIRDPAATEAALESAYHFSPEGAERESLRQELEALRGRPVTASQSGDSGGAATQPARAREPMVAGAPLPTIEGQAVAKIGDQTVTLEEILYAWSQTYGEQPPDDEQFEKFTRWYLDLTMLGEQSRRLGLDRTPSYALEMKLKRLLTLSEALTRKTVNELAAPSPEALRKFYDEHIESYSLPPRVRIGHIVAADERAARDVARALRDGQPFAQVARKYSIDAPALPEGYLIGEVGERSETIRQIGRVPGLAARLMQLDDGDTTGPIATSRGQHWIQVVSHHEREPLPYGQVEERVQIDYQKVEAIRQREALLAQLRASTPVEIFSDARQTLDQMRQAGAAAAAGTQATTATLEASAADAATTASATNGGPSASAGTSEGDDATTDSTEQPAPKEPEED